LCGDGGVPDRKTLAVDDHDRTLSMRLSIPFVLALLVSVAGCQKATPPTNSLDSIDNELVNGAIADESPANKALANAIHVDTAKTGSKAAPGHEAAPPRIADRSAAVMPAVTEDGAGGAVDGGSGCLGGLVYSNDWAAKLPTDLPMHPAGKLQEAAGHDGACQARVVSFTVPGDRGQLLGWYRAKAQAAGYSAGRADKGGDWILAGDKGPAAYTLIFGAPDHGETPVDYVWTSGG
jgi:hypothetical protein